MTTSNRRRFDVIMTLLFRHLAGWIAIWHLLSWTLAIYHPPNANIVEYKASVTLATSIRSASTNMCWKLAVLPAKTTIWSVAVFTSFETIMNKHKLFPMYYIFTYWQRVTHRPPGQNGRHFADDIFRSVFVNETFCILIRISLKFVPKGPIDNNPALV